MKEPYKTIPESILRLILKEFIIEGITYDTMETIYEGFDSEKDILFVLKKFGITDVDYEDIGFGLYAQSGSAIRTYINKDGMVVKERIKVSLITKAKTRTYLKPVSILPSGLADVRGEYTKELQTYYETSLNIQPFTGSNGLPTSFPNVSGDVISVQLVDGYLPTHNKFVSDLTTGLKNSYYLGSKYESFIDGNGNTIWNTIDGAKPVETFVSNPNTLTVNKTGRSTNEPILLVE
jgi:hypothetical protein